MTPSDDSIHDTLPLTPAQDQSASVQPSLLDIGTLRRRADQLSFLRDEHRSRSDEQKRQIEELRSYLTLAEKVSDALEQLSRELFSGLLKTVEEKITLALQEILEQPISFHSEVRFSRNAASVDFWIERDGKPEDLLNGQGGSVANIVSVCLRMFALTTLDEKTHRRFLLLDEQDCWLRSDLVPKMVKIIHDASKALGFQVLMISHHERHLFEQFADKVIELQWKNGTVECIDTSANPHSVD